MHKKHRKHTKPDPVVPSSWRRLPVLWAEFRLFNSPALGKVAASLVLVLSLASARGIILNGSDDPEANTTAPAAELEGSGWRLQGTWGAFLGTPVAPRHFLSAQHVGGQVGDTFVFRGASYVTVAAIADPDSDLILWEVDRSFPTFARLRSKGGETGELAVIFGRGAPRGGPVQIGGLFGSTLKGWFWGLGDGRLRWGENHVSDIVQQSAIGAIGAGKRGSSDLLKLNFDRQGGPNEAHLSAGDSGGAVFISDGDEWQLAGINYGVDGPYNSSPTGAGFFAAIFDEGGLYKGGEGRWVLQPDLPSDQPGAFYATRISARMDWIRSVIGAPEPPPDLPPPAVLQVSDSPDGPFTDETDAQVDSERQVIEVRRPAGPRFYRVSFSSEVRITDIHAEGQTLILTYQQ